MGFSKPPNTLNPTQQSCSFHNLQHCQRVNSRASTALVVNQYSRQNVDGTHFQDVAPIVDVKNYCLVL